MSNSERESRKKKEIHIMTTDDSTTSILLARIEEKARQAKEQVIFVGDKVAPKLAVGSLASTLGGKALEYIPVIGVVGEVAEAAGAVGLTAAVIYGTIRLEGKIIKEGDKILAHPILLAQTVRMKYGELKSRLPRHE